MITDSIWRHSKLCQEAEASFQASLQDSPTPNRKRYLIINNGYQAAADELEEAQSPSTHHAYPDDSPKPKAYRGRPVSERTNRIIQIIKDSPTPLTFADIQQQLRVKLYRSAIRRLLVAGVIIATPDTTHPRGLLYYSYADKNHQ